MDKRVKLAAIQFAEVPPSGEVEELKREAVTGRATLERARFFLRQAAVCGTEDVEGAEHNLNAAIVFGRSVTFHLQSQYGNRPDFDYWYAWNENFMRGDPLLSFFVLARNVILKEGPMPTPVVKKTQNVVGLLPVGFILLPPRRVGPWYRQGIKALLAEAWGAISLPFARLQLWWGLRREARRAQRRLPQSVTTRELYFVGSQYGNRRTLDLVREYLDRLEGVVKAAEDELGRDPNETAFPHLLRPRKEKK